MLGMEGRIDKLWWCESGDRVGGVVNMVKEMCEKALGGGMTVI